MKQIISLILLLVSVSICSAQEWKTKIGQDVPLFEVTKRDGKKISSKDLKGKVILINFFATWCPPCRAELPKVQEDIWEPLHDREDFELLILAREESWDKIDPFVKDFGYTMPFYPDLQRRVFGLFAKDTIPRNVVIDREGKIIYQSIGYTEEEFEKLFQVVADQLGIN